METATKEKQTINSVLKQSLGSLQSMATADPADAVEQERKENLSVIDYKMVTFSLAGKDYAIDIMKVKEIAKAGRFTYVPNTLPFVLGVYNLRGDIIPIVDLRLFFNIDIPEREYDAIENMLIVSVGEQTFGVVVDEIDKVVGIQKSTINPPHPLFGDINIKYIQGVVEVNNRLFILLDIERIFGFIPHDAKIWAEYDPENEKTYLLTTGVLWTNYLDDVEDILNRQDGQCDVSMEITVDESAMGIEGEEVIKDFRFLGITMLNDSPAMVKCNLAIANFQMDELKTSLQEMMKMYAIEMEGGENMDKDKVVEPEVKEEDFEEVPAEPEEEKVVEDEFACDPKKKRNCEEDDKKKEDEDDDKKVLGKKKYEELEAKYSALEKSYAELEAKLESMADYAELKAFKDAYDAEQYKAKVDAISKEFGLAEKDFKDIREKAYAKEISLENYEEKLALISYRQNAKKNFGAEKEKNEAMIIDSTDTEEISIYGELDKYFK